MWEPCFFARFTVHQPVRVATSVLSIYYVLHWCVVYGLHTVILIQEVDSIFKSIRSVEKWLRGEMNQCEMIEVTRSLLSHTDIDATVGRLQQQQQEEEEKEGEEGIKTQKACGEEAAEAGERGTGEGEVEGEQVDFPVFSTGTSESEGKQKCLGLVQF